MHCIHESVYVLPAAFAAALCRKIVFCQWCPMRPGAAGTNRCTFYINLLLLKANKAQGKKKKKRKRSIWFNSKGSCCEETVWWSSLLIPESTPQRSSLWILIPEQVLNVARRCCQSAGHVRAGQIIKSEQHAQLRRLMPQTLQNKAVSSSKIWIITTLEKQLWVAEIKHKADLTDIGGRSPWYSPLPQSLIQRSCWGKGLVETPARWHRVCSHSLIIKY